MCSAEMRLGGGQRLNGGLSLNAVDDVDGMRCNAVLCRCSSSCSGSSWLMADLHIPKAQCVAVAIRCLKALWSVLRGEGKGREGGRALQACMANAGDDHKGSAENCAEKKN